MTNESNYVEKNIEVLDFNEGIYYEDLAVRYSNLESRFISATSKEGLLEKVFGIAAQLTGVSLKMVKEQHYDDLEDSWIGKGQYHVGFIFYDFGQELVIDVRNIVINLDIRIFGGERG